MVTPITISWKLALVLLFSSLQSGDGFSIHAGLPTGQWQTNQWKTQQRWPSTQIGVRKKKSNNDEGSRTASLSSSFLQSAMELRRVPRTTQQKILDHLQTAGLWTANDWSNVDDEEESPDSQLLLLAQDFVDRPEVFSSLLITDFQFPPLLAHQVRALAMTMLQLQQQQPQKQLEASSSSSSSPPPPPEKTTSSSSSSRSSTQDATNSYTEDLNDQVEVVCGNLNTASKNTTNDATLLDTATSSVELDSKTALIPEISPSTAGATDQSADVLTNIDTGSSDIANVTKPHIHKGFRSVVVNEKAARRRRRHRSSTPADNMESLVGKQSTSANVGISIEPKFEYGLDMAVHPKLGQDLQDFYQFMTRPNIHSQEDPIRPATAKVYLCHAKQFFGWLVNNSNEDNTVTKSGRPKRKTAKKDKNLLRSIHSIFPNKNKESCSPIIEFIMWLRTNRDISVGYEANVLRGLIKLLKFRFSTESQTDSSYGGTTFDDIPIIKEVRKLHRDANKRQKLAPRSSDEKQKWLPWTEYLDVIKHTKDEVLDLLKNYYSSEDGSDEEIRKKPRYRKDDDERIYSLEEEQIAQAYQRYLILAIFACIPDRQRTMRELEIGRTLQREGDTDNGYWYIKHGPDDYKTGKSYGERPAMQLAHELTPAMDEFVNRWRPALRPTTNFLFVQSRTGKPLTDDSVYRRVTRCCFKYKGKKTNPHLLRDMLVTHVRESDASEKELEALALFMGHSINMQRTSYDRRTLTTKIAPAVKLLEAVNSKKNNYPPNGK